MFRKIEDFVKYYRERSAEHATLFEALTDSSLNQAVCDGHRKIGVLAWHIVQSAPGMAHESGLALNQQVLTEPVPTDATRLASAYRAVVEDVLASVQAQWTDKDLEGEVPMYGEQWARGYCLLALVAHEGHHIGQLTVLMRQAGLPVHGIYGPSKEEWALYGMEQPADLA